MNEILFFAEALITFFLVVLVKKFFGKEGLMVWVAAAMMLANLTVIKAIDLFGIEATLGNVMFASTFLATDILTENYGAKSAYKASIMGISAVVLFMAAMQLALTYIPAASDVSQESMATLFTLSFRASFASVLMCLVANLADVWLFEKIRSATGGRKLWLRNNVATLTCNCLENFFFVFLAFWGIYSFDVLMVIALSTSLFEAILAVLDTPFVYLACAKNKSAADKNVSAPQIHGAE